MASLRVLSGADKGREYVLGESQTIGRMIENNIVSSDTRQSRRNSRVYVDADGWWIEDLGSKNGTIVNGRSIVKHRLLSRDEIRIGETYFAFLDGDDPGRKSGSSEILGMAQVPNAPLPLQKPGLITSSGQHLPTHTSLYYLRREFLGGQLGFRILIAVGIAVIIFAAALVVWLVRR